MQHTVVDVYEFRSDRGGAEAELLYGFTRRRIPRFFSTCKNLKIRNAQYPSQESLTTREPNSAPVKLLDVCAQNSSGLDLSVLPTPLWHFFIHFCVLPSN